MDDQSLHTLVTMLTFNLGDFALYRIEPSGARYVAGFGKTFNLTADSLKRAAQS